MTIQRQLTTPEQENDRSAGTAARPAIPPPRFFFAGSTVAFGFYVIWSWLVHQAPAVTTSTTTVRLLARLECHAWLAVGFMVCFTDLGGVASHDAARIMGSIWQTATSTGRFASPGSAS